MMTFAISKIPHQLLPPALCVAAFLLTAKKKSSAPRLLSFIISLPNYHCNTSPVPFCNEVNRSTPTFPRFQVQVILQALLSAPVKTSNSPPLLLQT